MVAGRGRKKEGSRCRTIPIKNIFKTALEIWNYDDGTTVALKW